MITQAAVSAAVVATFAGTTLLASEMLGSDRLAGIPSAMLTLGAAMTASPLANLARRRGRRAALTTGYWVGALGALLAVFAGQLGTFALLVGAMLVFGAGYGANFQARFAAADLSPADRRARHISVVVWMGAVGGVLGPVIAPPVWRWGMQFGLKEYVGPVVMASLLLALSASIIWLRLRPDPLELAGGVATAETPKQTWRFSKALHSIATNSMARLGLAAMVVSQVAMVSVMTMTPLHMKDHGQAEISLYVIAAHVFGMFGLAPLVGRFTDRVSRTTAVRSGGLLLAAGTTATVIGGYQPILLFVGLFFLGLGWNVGLIAGSVLITESLADGQRVAAQGAGDLLISLGGAAAALLSGFVKQAAGFHWLANFATVAAVLLVMAAAAGYRRPVEAAAP
jgi:MFS family permease